MCVTSSEEYIRLSQESTRKLTEMADMVLQMETERDDIRTEFENYKSEVFMIHLKLRCIRILFFIAPWSTVSDDGSIVSYTRFAQPRIS